MYILIDLLFFGVFVLGSYHAKVSSPMPISAPAILTDVFVLARKDGVISSHHHGNYDPDFLQEEVAKSST